MCTENFRLPLARTGFGGLTRRSLLGAVASPAIHPLLSASGVAQAPANKWLLGVLTPLPRSAPHWAALRDELRRNGYVEGDNISIVGFDVGPDRLASTAVDMVAKGVAAIVCGGVAPTQAARQASTSIPILTVLDDFVAQGFATTLARPDGNTTGVSILGTELDIKRQEVLLGLVPSARRLGILADPASSPADHLESVQADARRRSLVPSLYRASGRADIAPAIDAAKAAGVEIFNVLASQMLHFNRAEIIAGMARIGVPAICQWPEWVAEGAFASYGPRFTSVYRQLATLLIKVLRGRRPSDIAIEQPDRLELVINAGTAKALGVSIPPSLLARADEVIE